MRTLSLLSIAANAIWARIDLTKNVRTCLMLLVFGCAMATTQTARAQITIDGSPSDWPGVFTNPAVVFKTFVTDAYNSSADDQFTVGSQDVDPISGWGWNNSLVNDKTDMNHAAMALIGHKLYFMGDRYANNGDASIGIWVLKNRVNMLPDGTFSGTHADGDVLITSAFTGGGGNPEKHIYKWLSGGLVEVILGTTAANVAVNTGDVAAPAAWAYVPKAGSAGTYPANAFFEGFVDLDSMGVGVDICFTEFFMSTRNSQSTSASLQDLVRGLFATRPIVTVADVTVCSGQPAVFTANVTGGLAPITYSWNGGGYAASNTYTINPATVNTVVTVRAQGDNGCISEPDTANLNVTPSPTINTVPNAAYCNGASASAISFTSPSAGATFTWASSANVGFGTSGSGGIGAYTAVNAGTTQVVATVTVNVTAGGCTGTPTTFMVSVNPTPTVNTIGNAVYCNGNAAGAINFSGAVAGTTFSWASSADVGFGTSGSNVTSIGAYTATNTGTSPVVATVTVTPTANGCTGAATTFMVTVNPTPTVAAHGDATYCKDQTASAISFTGGISGTTYSWTSSTDVGFGTTGTGNIGSYIATNGGATMLVATVIVTPSANGCTGVADTFLITVNPAPGPNAPVDNAILCNNELSAPIDLTGLDTTVTTYWTSSADIGFGTSGTGDIPSFIGTNGTSAPLVATVTVTSSSTSGCASGDTTGFTITVNPNPGANAPVSNITLCSGASADSIDIRGLDMTTIFSWTSTANVGFGTSGTGNIAAYTAITNPGPGAITATVTVTGMSPNGCPGDTTGFTVTIYPNPTVTARDTSVCIGTTFCLTSLGTPTGGTWSGTGVSGVNFNSGGLSAGTYGILYTYADGNGCSASDSAHITLTNCGSVFGTFTQGFYGSTNGKHCDGAGTNRNALSLINYLLGLGGDLTVGRAGREVIIPVSAAATLNSVLPGGGTPNKLTIASNVTISNVSGSTFAVNYLTKQGRINNVLLAQTIVLKLSLRMSGGLGAFPIVYNAGGNSWFQTEATTTTDCSTFNAVSCSADSFSFKYSVTNYLTHGGTTPATVTDLVNLADDLLGGVLIPGTTVGGYVVPSYADVNAAIDVLNNAFDGWRFWNGSYGTNLNAGCYGSAKPGHTADGGTEKDPSVALQAQMHIYPNPTTGTFTIEVPAIDKDAHITILDVNGRIVKSLVLPANTYGQRQQVELPNVARGVYFIRVENNGNIFTKRLMLE